MKKSFKSIPCLLALSLLISVLFVLLADGAALLLQHRREQQYFIPALQAAEEFAVPFHLVMAVIRTESGFRPRAVSSAGAIGLMQLLPETFQDIGTRLLNEAPDAASIHSPAENIRYGTCYLGYLFRQFKCWEIALAAYNAGEGRVRAWLADPTLSPDGTLTVIPYPETMRYVQSVTSALAYYREKYKF